MPGVMTIKNDKMIRSLLCILLMINGKCSASQQKILKRNAEFQDLDADLIDHDTIQRSWRTDVEDEEYDPKNIFFLRMDMADKKLPLLGSSNSFNLDTVDNRSKRQADEQLVEKDAADINTDIENEFSTQRQELDNADTLQVSTEITPSTTQIELEEISSKNNFIPINDFIRFRRGLSKEPRVETGQVDDEFSSKSERPNFNVQNENHDVQNNRGPRGLSTEEWVKFPYQVQRAQKSDDSYISSGDFSQPRRVHFITQKQFEVESPTLSSNSRQGRVLDQPRPSRDQPRMDMDLRKSPEQFSTRYGRDFEGPPDYPVLQYSRGRYFERDLIENRRPDSRSLEFYPRNRDRRIIYYANLPEIPRNPPRFREMERYRNPFDDRYSADQYQRNFYRDQRNEELPPMKVSADINVREVKKNPEKRIYSDVKRKYGYNIPSFDGDQTTRH